MSRIETPELTAFHAEVIDLNVAWQMFEGLYSDDARWDLFNKTGANFWSHLQLYLLDYLVAGISRFFDPPETGKSKNLSLAAIINSPELASFRKDLDERVKKLHPIWTRGMQVLRNKRLSHSDLLVATGRAPLPPVAFSDIKAVILGISDIATLIEHNLNQTTRSHTVHISDWIPTLIRHLEAGVTQLESERHTQKRVDRP